MQFLTPLRTEETGIEFRVRLIAPLQFEIGAGATLIVPASTTTDYASVPRLLWWLFPPHGRYKRAAVLHDYLYTQTDIPRALADMVFLSAMQSIGVGAHVRYPMWIATRLFGWRHKR